MVAQLLDLVGPSGLESALDIACGPGWFTKKLVDYGFAVTGLEGRADVIAEARDRVPKASFIQVDLENPSNTRDIPPADLVFCFGCLYHMENPFMVIRQILRWTRKLLILETQITRDDEASFRIVEEGHNETQSLNYIAMIPSDSAVVKLLSVAGFPNIYEWTGPVAHDDFCKTAARHKRRSIYVASHEPLDVEYLLERAAARTPKPSYDKST